MLVPIIAGKPLFVWLGIILFIQVVLQVISGKKWIKLPAVYHRNNGWLMAIVAAVHVYYALTF